MTGSVNGMNVDSIYRDTGCSTILISDQVLPNSDLNECITAQVADYLGNVYFSFGLSLFKV